MVTDAGRRRSALVGALSGPEPVVAVELRPPRSGLVTGPAMDTWIDLEHAARTLSRGGTFTLLTDGAVGDAEEENLRHIAANLAGDDASRGARIGRLVPFLTCLHTLDYCLHFADRAVRHGVESLTVVGGDPREGSRRCLSHSHLLRQRIRERWPGLALGGWVNPHREIEAQASRLADASFAADYYLTQIVSHHDRSAIEGWLETADRQGVELPMAWGVFYYRNGDPASLERLSAYFHVPVAKLAREFSEGTTPARVCARTIAMLRDVGMKNVYVCNLGARRAASRLAQVLAALDGPA